MHTYQGGVVDDCREHCFSCGILGYFKEQRRAAPDDAWDCPPLGSNKVRQPVDITPIPLYFNDEMSPELVGQFAERVPQRRKSKEQSPQRAQRITENSQENRPQRDRNTQRTADRDIPSWMPIEIESGRS